MKSAVWAFLFYSLITVAVNFPLFPKISSATYGYVGDNYGYLWQLWWWRETPRTLELGNLTPLLGAPMGGPVNYYFYEPLLIYLGRALTLVVNYFAAFNILLLVTFPLAGLTTYLLVKYLTGGRSAALISGLIYAFLPYHFWHSYAHFSLAQVQWLPLFLLALIIFWRRESLASSSREKVKAWGFLLEAFCLVFFSCFFYGYFALLLAASWLGLDLGWRLWKKQGFWSRDFLLLAGLFFLVGGGLCFFFWHQMRVGDAAAGITRVGRDIDHALALSARPWDYFLPAYDHPIFGKYVVEARHRFWLITRDWRMASAFKPESILYLGIIPTFLAMAGGFFGWGDKARRKILGLLALMAIAFFSFSLPPYLPWRSWRLYFPSAFLFKLFPKVRVLARFGVMVGLMVAILAGFGISFLVVRIKKPIFRFLLIGSIFLAIGFDYLNVPPFRHYTDYSQVPCYYQWLKSQPGDFILADYPLSFDFAESQVWQTLHSKRIFNSASEWPQAKLWPEIADLGTPQAVLKLKNLGVKYVVYHIDDYLYGGTHPVDGERSRRFGVPPGPKERPGLKTVLSCDGAEVLEVL